MNTRTKNRKTIEQRKSEARGSYFVRLPGLGSPGNLS